ncbi:hypothetical protein ACEUZ9_001342 [Paracoccus litorisediminis]|uniref:hypothetical protein n=1 Tax=Paracoccus litorisediminis TaxID=2006130 RepID=UPI003732F750
MSESVRALARAVAEAFGGNQNLAQVGFLAAHAAGPIGLHRFVSAVPSQFFTASEQSELLFWLYLGGNLRLVLERIDAMKATRFDPVELRGVLAEEVRYARAAVADWPEPPKVVP